MVVSANQWLWELLCHLCAKVCLCRVVPASVNIHIGDVAIMAISSHPYLEATLDGMFCFSALELYHSLTDAVLTTILESSACWGRLHQSSVHSSLDNEQPGLCVFYIEVASC